MWKFLLCCVLQDRNNYNLSWCAFRSIRKNVQFVADNKRIIKINEAIEANFYGVFISIYRLNWLKVFFVHDRSVRFPVGKCSYRFMISRFFVICTHFKHKIGNNFLQLFSAHFPIGFRWILNDTTLNAIVCFNYVLIFIC